jgi:hypothetical protein
MNESLDLGKIERKAFSSYMQDGLWDIFIGFLLLGFGLRIYTDEVMYTLLIFVGIGIMIIGRRYVTLPRLGLARFSPERERKHVFLLLAILALVLFMAALMALSTMDLLPSLSLLDIAISMIVAVVFALTAYYLGTFRIFIYGLMLASIIYLVGIIEDELASLISIAFGAVVLILGIVLLMIFIRKYPVSKENVDDAR